MARTVGKPKMAVDLGPLRLKNPLMTASGTFGYGMEYAGFIDLSRLGALIVKGLSLEPRPGNPPPRIMETTGGMLNAIGLENVGVKTFIAEKLPPLRAIDVPVIANIFGETVEEYQRTAELLDRAQGISALELNISCPNVKKGGLAFGADPDLAAEVTAKVRDVSSLPLIVKERGGAIIEVNPLESELSRISDVVVRGPSGEALPALVKALRRLA